MDAAAASRYLDLAGERSRYDAFSVEHRLRLRVAIPISIECQGHASVIDHEFRRGPPDDAGCAAAGDGAWTVRRCRAGATQAGRGEATGRKGRAAGAGAGGSPAAAEPGREQPARLHTAR